jgi:RNA polymerase sigma-70 factor (ECF subfamily)
VHQVKEEPGLWITGQKPAELPDCHLVEMARRDPTTFVHLYDRYVDTIYRYCAQRLSQTAAEDATSVTFLNALKAINRFDHDRGVFRAWLFRIAHNAVIDQTRLRNHAPLDDLWFEDPGVALDDHVVAIDERQTLLRAVEQLPPDQRQVIHLRLASLTGAEIAEAMDRSHVAVRALQHRAIKRLRTLLMPAGKEEQTHD